MELFLASTATILHMLKYLLHWSTIYTYVHEGGKRTLENKTDDPFFTRKQRPKCARVLCCCCLCGCVVVALLLFIVVVSLLFIVVVSLLFCSGFVVLLSLCHCFIVVVSLVIVVSCRVVVVVVDGVLLMFLWFVVVWIWLFCC